MSISVVFFACAVRSGFVQISHLRLETSDCILHRSYVCKLTKKSRPFISESKGFLHSSVHVHFYLLFSHEPKWEMRLRSTPRCKSDDKRYSLDFEHQGTINCPISQPVLKPGLPAEPLNAPLELWEVAAVLVELLYEVLSAIFCFHFVQNDEVSDLRERSVLW